MGMIKDRNSKDLTEAREIKKTWQVSHWKRPRCWEKDQRQKEKGMEEDKMVRQHHRLNGHEFEQTPEDSKLYRSLTCASPWGCRVGHDLVTERATRSSLARFVHCESMLFLTDHHFLW